MIVTTPNSVLTTPAKPVQIVDKRIKDIIDRMKKELLATRNPKGVGLAAPQIGIPLRIFITRPKEDSVIGIFINPDIIWKSDQMTEIDRGKNANTSLKNDKKLEGCLSIPEVWGHLKRADKVRLKFMDENGIQTENEYSGFMATIIQHETDHVNGILFTQRVLEQKEKLYRIDYDKEGEEKLVEIEL